MKINYIVGDLFKTPDLIIVHGCNDHGVMGSGVAKIVRSDYPEAYQAYVEAYGAKGGFDGAEIIWAKSNGKMIGNAVSQSGYGAGRRFVNYEWIATIFEIVADYATKHDQPSVSIPKIGAGLGGGDWNVISAIIQSVKSDVVVNVYVLDESEIPKNA